MDRVPSDLERVDDVPFDPRYLRAGRPGAVDVLWLHPRAAERLRAARSWLRARVPRADLLVWDGWRPAAVQRGLFEEHVRALVAAGTPEAQARAEARTFVASPDGTYPHGTGGAVDLTLTRNGTLAAMGTDFDEFSPRAHRAWFRENPPATRAEAEAATSRTLLEEAMTAAGFVGLDDEWWHYEWGTVRWARAARPAVP